MSTAKITKNMKAKGAGRILDSHYSMIVLQFGPIKNGYPGMICPVFLFSGGEIFFYSPEIRWISQCDEGICYLRASHQ
jgi:hypothetical protein